MAKTTQSQQTKPQAKIFNRSQLCAISNFCQMLQDVGFFTTDQHSQIIQVIEQMTTANKSLQDLKGEHKDVITRRNKLEKAQEENAKLTNSNNELTEQLNSANATIRQLNKQIKELKERIAHLETQLVASQTVIITKQIKKKGYTTQYDQQIVDLKHDGYSVRAIAAELGVSKSYVQGRIQHLNL